MSSSKKYRVVFVGGVDKVTKGLPPKVVAVITKFCSGALVEDPYSAGKPLKGDRAGTYSARRGQYRIIYRIHDELIIVEVLRAGHRSRVYRPFVLV